MALKGKKSVQIEIKSCGDVFHELLGKKQHNVSNLTPNTIQGCTLHEGDWGRNGSVISWNYILDGKKDLVSKQIIHVDEENKTVTYDEIEGDLKKLFKSFLFILHVDKKGDTSLVTWTLDYEKLHEGVPDPDSLLDFFTNMTKDIEAGHLKQ